MRAHDATPGGADTARMHLDAIEKTVDRLLGVTAGGDRRLPLKGLGFLSCTGEVQIRHVPFFDPCLTLVLSGRKTVYHGDKTIHCDAGHLIAQPGPSSVNLCLQPDPRTKRYAALIIPFKAELLDRLVRSHGLVHEVRTEPPGVLAFTPDETLYQSIHHYLITLGNAKLVSHRLMEILLILAGRDPELLSFGLHRELWAARVRAVLSADLAQSWTLAEVCKRLATSERTLRRNLTQEGTSFRALLYELRLASALMQLLQTSLPIYRIAYDCGYRSVSRFTNNFHKRFGVPPKQFREKAGESGQSLTA